MGFTKDKKYLKDFSNFFWIINLKKKEMNGFRSNFGLINYGAAEEIPKTFVLSFVIEFIEANIRDFLDL